MFKKKKEKCAEQKRKAVTSDVEVKGLMGNKQGLTDMLLKLERAKFCFFVSPSSGPTDAA